MSDCTERHPEINLRCQQEGKHLDHAVWYNGEWVMWQVPAPPSPSTRTPPSNRDLADTARALQGGNRPDGGPVSQGGDRADGGAISPMPAEVPRDGSRFARHTDPETSKAAADQLSDHAAQKAKLLAAWAEAVDLTDDIAAIRAGLYEREGANWWHRCSDLRQEGLIERTGEKRMGQHGRQRMVCRITDLGRKHLRP